MLLVLALPADSRHGAAFAADAQRVVPAGVAVIALQPPPQAVRLDANDRIGSSSIMGCPPGSTANAAAAFP